MEYVIFDCAKKYLYIHSLHKLIYPRFTNYVFFYFSTTNLAACVCVCQCAIVDKFLPARSHFDSKRPENFVRIATFPSATFGPLFAFPCPLFFTKNNNLEWESSRFATRDVLKTVTMTSA